MQHEITKPIPLLDDRGNLTEPGWARRPLPVYDRSRVKGGPARRKEWDYYLVMGDGFALALTIADSSCLGVASISLLDFQEGGQVTRSPVRLLPMGATGLPGTSQRGNAAVSGRGYALLFHNDGQNRTLTAHMERFREDQTLDAHVILTEAPPESMVICTPFGKPGHFHYNQKINGLRAQGTVRLGEQVRRFEPETAFGAWGCGPCTIPGTGPRPRACWTACPLASTWAAASETPRQPRRTRSFMTEGSISCLTWRLACPGTGWPPGPSRENGAPSP